MIKGFRDLIIINIRNNIVSYLVVAIALLIGIITGSLVAGTVEDSQMSNVSDYLQQFWQQCTEYKQNSAVNRQILLNNLLFLLLIYFLGIMIIGIPLIPLIVSLKGFALGFTVSILLQQSGWGGFLLVLTSVIPQNIIYLPALLIAGAIGLAFSSRLLAIFTKQQYYYKIGFAAFSAAMTALFAAAVFASVVQMYLTPVLIKLAAGCLGY